MVDTMSKFNMIWKNVVLLFLVFFVRAEPKSTAPALLGIDLGFSYITSAYFTAAGPIIASRFEAPEVYKRMMLATVNGTADQFCSNDSDQNSMLEDLKSILQQSLAESRQQKGDAINIGTLFVPDQLIEERNEKCWHKIFDALDAISPNHVSVVNIRSTRWKVYSFPPDDCYDEFGKGFVNASIKEDEFLVMVLELVNSALKVSLVEISVPGPVFGVLSTFSVSDVSWPTVDREELQKEIASMFRGQHVGDVRAVLFSAEYSMTEADEVAIQNIIETLDEAAPGLAAKVHDFGQGIEFRNAIGVACYARQLVIYPFDPYRDEQYADPPADALHHEL